MIQNEDLFQDRGIFSRNRGLEDEWSQNMLL